MSRHESKQIHNDYLRRYSARLSAMTNSFSGDTADKSFYFEAFSKEIGKHLLTFVQKCYIFYRYTDLLGGSKVQKNITELGPKEADFLSHVASSANHQFTIRTAIEFWGSPEKAWKKLRHLERKGWIARIERGKYLVVPLEAGPERQWSEDPYLIAGILVQPAAIAYWAAIRHWNWTEQIPRIVYVQTTKRKKNPGRQVFGVEYKFVTVSKKKFYGHVKEWRDGKSILITDREKTLVDCADDVKRAGGIEELAKAVKAAAQEISWQKLHEHVMQFPNRAVRKRLGFLFETLLTDLHEDARIVLDSWRHDLSAGIALLQPSNHRMGRVVTRWRIRVNKEVG
jgi:predicted transcriptional regulator of viral defense system